MLRLLPSIPSFSSKQYDFIRHMARRYVISTTQISFTSLYTPLSSVGECHLRAWAILILLDGPNSALSPVVYGDIELSINTQYNTSQFFFQHNSFFSTFLHNFSLTRGGGGLQKEITKVSHTQMAGTLVYSKIHKQRVF